MKMRVSYTNIYYHLKWVVEAMKVPMVWIESLVIAETHATVNASYIENR